VTARVGCALRRRLSDALLDRRQLLEESRRVRLAIAVGDTLWSTATSLRVPELDSLPRSKGKMRKRILRHQVSGRA
jgi:hypothetical protein